MLNPLEQFNLTVCCKVSVYQSWFLLLNIDWVSITILFVIIFLLQIYSTLVGKTLMNVILVIWAFIVGLFGTMSSRTVLVFLPCFAVMFFFILESNLLGLYMYGFALTSHAYVTFGLSFTVFSGIVALGLVLHKMDFIKYFIPAGITNIYLRLFVIVIEVLSFFIRPLSLGLRLFANMLAGHTLLHILTTFVIALQTAFSYITLLIPFLLISAVIMLEVGIAFIQTYVFIVLATIYLAEIIGFSTVKSA